MPTIVKPILAAGLFLALSACSKLGMGQDEMTWAREALDRNDHLQVVASDSQAKTFTVRLKDSGQLVVIPVDQLVAGPAAAMHASSTKQAASPEAPVEAPPPSPDSPAAPAPVSAPSPVPSQAAGNPTIASSGEPAHPAGRQAAGEDSYA